LPAVCKKALSYLGLKNTILETGNVLRKKGSRRPTKRSAENIEEGEQRTIAEIDPRNNLLFGTVQLILKKDLHFFLYRVSVVHEIIPRQQEPPQPTTPLWIILIDR
jgi:hypothetical protein